jgi:hypothetical protein
MRRRRRTKRIAGGTEEKLFALNQFRKMKEFKKAVTVDQTRFWTL